MKQSTSITLSERDKKRIKELCEIYDIKSVSELIRILVDQELIRINHYKELNIK